VAWVLDRLEITVAGDLALLSPLLATATTKEPFPATLEVRTTLDRSREK
jgi:hypothetical protein